MARPLSGDFCAAAEQHRLCAPAGLQILQRGLKLHFWRVFSTEVFTCGALQFSSTASTPGNAPRLAATSATGSPLRSRPASESSSVSATLQRNWQSWSPLSGFAD